MLAVCSRIAIAQKILVPAVPLRQLRLHATAALCGWTAGRPSPQQTLQSRAFVQSARVTLPLRSPSRNIHDGPVEDKHDKWGWVIYRCSYEDDVAWERFKQIITQRTRDQILKSDAPEALDSLAWTFVDDRPTLEDIPINQLRSLFKDWAAMAIQTEQPRATDHKLQLSGPRYNYFVQVDEHALNAVVSPTEQDPFRGGLVKFVDAIWTPHAEAFPGQIEEPSPENVHEPIDGCTEENVGWILISPGMIGAHFYEASYTFTDAWYAYYVRPPERVWN
ncbi:hypothetical protein B0A48_03549 [Cryoendolithus antarcticus]|uniref:Uncharacterized protein n=1 Tax=Cryoendolithus antarcticus TaxID=1507870 RepID=A0A1V8TKS3_9PEZI|nr:hypothetical protein B0A48_03549 [Cryoendolithus antarcticus]